MIQVPSDLRYAQTHEWAREEDDGSITIGVSDPIQASLGDIVFIELPEVGQEVKAQQEVGAVESEIITLDVCAPVSGEIIEVNELLRDRPDLINADAYHDGWIFKMMPNDPDEIKDLLDGEAYQEIVEELDL